MATKTITLPITCGVAGKVSKDKDGNVTAVETKYIPPGTPITLDADEADKLVAQHGGAEVVPAAAAPAAK
jgi:hypothetical protein